MLSSIFYSGSIEVMDDRSWMYRDSPQRLRRMNYCNGVQGFINFVTSIPRNFSEGGIRCPCRKYKNKKCLHPDVITMHLLYKGFMEDYMCWYAHEELFVRKESMIKRMVVSTSSVAISMDFILYKCRENHGREIWYDFVLCTFKDLYGSLRNGN